MSGAIYAFGALLAVIVILAAVLIVRAAKRRGDWENANSISLSERLDRALGAGLDQPSAIKKVVPRVPALEPSVEAAATPAPPPAPPAPADPAPVQIPAPTVQPPAPAPAPAPPPAAASTAPVAIPTFAPDEYRLDGPVEIRFADAPLKVTVRAGSETAAAFRRAAEELIRGVRNADT